MIYLIGSDCYNESLCTDYCVGLLEDLPKLVSRYEADLYSNEIRNCSIVESNTRGIVIYFECRSSWDEDDEWDTKEYSVRIIPLLKET